MTTATTATLIPMTWREAKAQGIADSCHIWKDGVQYLDTAKVQEWFARGAIDANGVIRWTSNDRVPFPDMINLLSRFANGGDAINVEASNAARDADNAEFFRTYKPAPLTDEQRFEMRAAFGPGVEVVDVFSGTKYRT